VLCFVVIAITWIAFEHAYPEAKYLVAGIESGMDSGRIQPSHANG
jgi:hypothetical protein